jgi:hypothetical protein
MPLPPRPPSLAALVLTAMLAGCTGEGSSLPALSLPPPDSKADSGPGLQSLITPEGVVVGTPTEVYTRIARGVLTCWFGADGPLKTGYIYHAEASPASKGGNSEIKIMTRDQDADDPRALRAYRVLISPSGDKTRLEIENVRIPEPMAARLKLDVERWSRNEEGCGESPVTAGWGAEPVAAAKGDKTKKEKKKNP